MKFDLWKFFAIFTFAFLIGYTLSHILLVLFIASLAIIAWQMVRLNLLYKWIENPKQNPLAETSGQFYLLHRSIHRINASNKKRKRKLSALLNQFRKAVGTLPDTIILIDENGKIEWANDKAKDLLRIRWPEDSGVRFCDLIRHPEVEAHINSAKYTNVKQGVIINSLYQQDQTLNLKCVRYTKELRMIIVRDVSRLIHINQMHTDFVANVSHELKTPLTVLNGYIEILQDNDKLPTQFRKPLEQMNIQSVRMQLIVNDLLYLAKLEDHETVKASEPVNVSHLVSSIVEAVQPLIEEKQQTLSIDVDHELTLCGSQKELHSAFLNLLSNAINYTPSKGKIAIQWIKTEDGAKFSVKDNGQGIPAQHISRLTERFYRVDDDRSRDGGGTGLGLAIVKHVLQRQGGEFLINSEVGSGSEFKCLFNESQLL